MTMKMMKQKKRTQMICTNRWLETQTMYLISLVIFVKIPFCISKENCIFVQICSFICIFRLWSFRKSWSMQKCYKIIYNMSIFDEVDFSSFGACAIMKKRLEPSFLTWVTWGIFCVGSKHPREAMCKVSALLYFFPTKNIIHLDYIFWTIWHKCHRWIKMAISTGLELSHRESRIAISFQKFSVKLVTCLV